MLRCASQRAAQVCARLSCTGRTVAPRQHSLRSMIFSSGPRSPAPPALARFSNEYSLQRLSVSSRSHRQAWTVLGVSAAAVLAGTGILLQQNTAFAEESDADKQLTELLKKSLDSVAAALKLSPEYLQSCFPHLFVGPSLQLKVVPFDYGANIGSIVDHTVLKANATEAEIVTLCQEAVQNQFAAVCVNGSRAALAIETLRKQPSSSKVKVAAVVGFPLGAATISSKAAEARELFQLGVDEVDMVLNVGLLKDRNLKAVYEDIKAVVAEARNYSGKVVKVILETCLLTDEEICTSSLLSVLAGADFVKTSTGFSTSGATVSAVNIMKLTVGDRALVKASGGVRSYTDSVAMVKAGAARIGTSSGIAIAKGSASTASY